MTMSEHNEMSGGHPDAAPMKGVAQEVPVTDPHKYQDRNAFGDFLGGGEVREPTPEEREEIERSLDRLAEIFNGLDCNWQLDGAINISALNEGDFIRVHKDIDVSIEDADLEKIDAHLKKKGYGLFISYPKDPEDPNSPMTMERVHADDLRASEAHPMIAAVEPDGKLREGGVLNFVDTHVIKRDADGDPVGLGGAKLPEKWFVPRVEHAAKGPLHLAHPAKVAFFKLHDDRSYDMKDLERLAELDALTEEDLKDIRSAFEAENDALKAEREAVMDDVIGRMAPDADYDGIVKAFMANPAIGKGNDEAPPIIREIARAVAAVGTRTPERIKEAIWSVIREPLDVSKVDTFERLVRDAKRKKGLREDLDR